MNFLTRWLSPTTVQENKNGHSLTTTANGHVQTMTKQDRREIALSQLAKFYKDAVVHVFRAFEIGARIKEWNVAPRYITIGLNIYDPKKVRRAMNLTTEIGHAAGLGTGTQDPPIVASLMGNQLVYQFRMPEYYRVADRKIRLWRDITLKHPGINGAVGLGLYAIPVYYEFPHAAPHAVVSGATGSGKTELIKTMVAQQMLHNSPDELTVVMADPKGDMSELFRNKQHMLWQPAVEYDEIDMMILHVHAEYRRRFHHNTTDAKRWLIVIDEADQDRVLGNEDNLKMIMDVALRGRSLKMNLLIGTHKANKDTLGGLVNELRNRFLGAVATARDSGNVEGGLSLHKLSGAGDFYHSQGGESVRFQAAMTYPMHLRPLEALNVPPVPTSPPDIDPALAVEAEPNPPHRKRIEPDPKRMAYYLYHGPENVSERMAREAGWKRTRHLRNREAVLEMLAARAEIEKLSGKWPAEWSENID